jgi:diamine N-acetyltransferase
MFVFKPFQKSNTEALVQYLSGLSNESANRFGPHKYDTQSVLDFYSTPEKINGFLVFDGANAEIIGYAIIKTGFLEHDKARLESYGLILNNKTDCTFAPSVTDKWQGKGVGESMFLHIVKELEKQGITRVILWGGVQAGNERAIRYYTKLGFKVLGKFEYFGLNYDMIFEI